MGKIRKLPVELLKLRDYGAYFRKELTGIYPAAEADSIFHILVEDLLNLPKTSIYTGNISPDSKQRKLLLTALDKLMEYVPVQQITGFTYFGKYKILVNKHVLIPRPETEELVSLVNRNNRIKKAQILDIGTGSGCIAIALKKNIPDAIVSGIDFSAKALSTARKNAVLNEADVQFKKADIFKYENLKTAVGKFDYIVSNPPYIRDSERKSMHKNVVLHEPAEALYVPDESPLIFYEAIAKAGNGWLKKGGMIFVEINEKSGRQTANLFSSFGYGKVSVMKDFKGKDRFIKATKV